MATTIVTRQQCGLLAPNVARLSLRPVAQVVGVTVHVTVTPATDPLERWREIQHAAMNGSLPSGDHYGDIPYNAGITSDGRILAGRDGKYVGAHALSTGNVANIHTFGYALIGTGGVITRQAQTALRTAVYLTTLQLGRRPLLFDHFDWRALGGIATACPDPPTAAFVDQLRREARAGH